MASLSLTDLCTVRGLSFPEGQVMSDPADAQRMQNNMRRALAPGEVNLTQGRACRMIKEQLDACERHAVLLDGLGRSSEKFWFAAMADVFWTRGLTLTNVEEFALELAEAARLGLTPEQNDMVASGEERVTLDLPGYPPVAWAAVQLLAIVKSDKRGTDNRGNESVRAYGGREHDDQGRPIGGRIPSVPCNRGRRS